MMIAFSIVIGNSQCSPCSLHFVSNSANVTSVGQSMVKYCFAVPQNGCLALEYATRNSWAAP